MPDITSDAVLPAARESGVNRGNLKFMEVLYVLLMFVTCMSTYSMAYTKLKLGSVAFIGLAFIDLCLFFRKDYLKLCAETGKRYFVYIAFILSLSFLIYAGSMSDPSVIKRGMEKVIYQTFTILIALGAVYLFGKKAADLTFRAFALFNLTAVGMSLMVNRATVVSDTVHFLTSGGDAVGFFRTLELSETTFSFGLLIVYFVVDGWKENWKKIAVCLFFFMLGFKRIAAFGLLLALVFYFLTSRYDGKKLHFVGRVFCWVFLLFGFVFVTSIQTGAFVDLMDKLGIDMMGRQNLYRYINRFYKISPLYFGRGFESVTLLLKNAGDIKVGDTTISKLSALHNDYLTMYIEMGFWGFLIWLWYFLIYLRRYFEKFPRKVYRAYIMCTIYLFTTFLTDNTAMFYLTSTLYRLVPLTFAAEGGSADAETHKE